jgi:hypothetical protein
MTQVEVSVECLQPMEKSYVSRSSPLPPCWPLRYRHMCRDRKLEELSFRSAPSCPGKPGI